MKGPCLKDAYEWHKKTLNILLSTLKFTYKFVSFMTVTRDDTSRCKSLMNLVDQITLLQQLSQMILLKAHLFLLTGSIYPNKYILIVYLCVCISCLILVGA